MTRDLKYDDFELTLTRRESGFAASAESSDGAQTPVVPLTADPTDLRHDLEIVGAVRGGSVSRSGGTPLVRGRESLSGGSQKQIAKALGGELFQAVMPPEIQSLYRRSLDRARATQKVGVRLRLKIEDPALALVPWEYMYDEGEGDFLAFSAETPIVRHPPLPRPIDPLDVELPLRILGMVASPEGLDPLDVDGEVERIETALRPLTQAGQVRLVWTAGSSLPDLEEPLHREPWHVFHFIGHGVFDEERQEGAIVLAGADGRAKILNGDQLARRLETNRAVHQRNLALVVLNSCEGATSSETNLFSSTAAVLVRKGIPAVVSMQSPISDRAASVFSEHFYHRLVVDQRPVDLAVTLARQALDDPDQFEWGTPVLHMRARDGQLFRFAPTGAAAAVPEGAPPAAPTAAAIPAGGERLQRKKLPWAALALAGVGLLGGALGLTWWLNREDASTTDGDLAEPTSRPTPPVVPVEPSGRTSEPSPEQETSPSGFPASTTATPQTALRACGPFEICRWPDVSALSDAPIDSRYDLGLFLGRRKTDIVAMLGMAGWTGDPDDFIHAVGTNARAQDYGPGQHFQWLGVWPDNSPDVLTNRSWAGEGLLPAWVFSVDSRGSSYLFVILQETGAIALLEVRAAASPPSYNVSAHFDGQHWVVRAPGAPPDSVVEVRTPSGHTRFLSAEDRSPDGTWRVQGGEQGPHEFIVRSPEGSWSAATIASDHLAPPTCEIVVGDLTSESDLAIEVYGNPSGPVRIEVYDQHLGEVVLSGLSEGPEHRWEISLDLNVDLVIEATLESPRGPVTCTGVTGVTGVRYSHRSPPLAAALVAPQGGGSYGLFASSIASGGEAAGGLAIADYSLGGSLRWTMTQWLAAEAGAFWVPEESGDPGFAALFAGPSFQAPLGRQTILSGGPFVGYAWGDASDGQSLGDDWVWGAQLQLEIALGASYWTLEGGVRYLDLSLEGDTGGAPFTLDAEPVSVSLGIRRQF